jgi:hypothetical protein
MEGSSGKGSGDGGRGSGGGGLKDRESFVKIFLKPKRTLRFIWDVEAVG